MRVFRKKPIEVTAFLWNGSNDIMEWANNVSMGSRTSLHYRWLENTYETLTIKTLEGEMNVAKGDWVICGIQGEFYPCKPDIFEATYEEI